MTKNVNVTGRNGTTKPTNCMDLTREKAYTLNCENAQKLFTLLCLTVIHFVGAVITVF